MPHTGNYKQIFFTSNTLFSDSFDYLNGPYLMSANSVSKDVLIEGYETVKVMEYDPEQVLKGPFQRLFIMRLAWLRQLPC